MVEISYAVFYTHHGRFKNYIIWIIFMVISDRSSG